ncbi:hypothetical protein AGMMS50249_3780 [candidate division SR1 bacterium]|nr:hypothetical protein AGMMS50249_3780 [candidate division SR1 bacterium]
MNTFKKAKILILFIIFALGTGGMFAEDFSDITCKIPDTSTSEFTFLINNQPCSSVETKGRFLLEIKPVNPVSNAYFRVSYFYPYSGSSVLRAAKQSTNSYRNLVPYSSNQSETITATYVDAGGNPLSEARTFTINYKTGTNPPEPPQPPEPPLTGNFGKFGVYYRDSNDISTHPEYQNFIIQNGIDEIYLTADLSDTAQTSQFISRANQHSISVFYLIGEYQRIDDFTSFQAEISKYQTYQDQASASAKFAGLHLDVEPHQHPDFASNRAQKLADYLAFVVKTRETYPNEKIDFDIPFWFDDTISYRGQQTPLYQAVMSEASRVFVMAYRDSADAMADVAKEELAFAKSTNKQIFLSAETYSEEGDHVSFAQEGAEYMMSELKKLEIKIGSENGIAIHWIRPRFNMSSQPPEPPEPPKPPTTGDENRYPQLDYIPGGVVNGITVNASPFTFKYQITDLSGKYSAEVANTGAVLHYEFLYDGKVQTGRWNNYCHYIQGVDGKNPDHYQTSFSILFTGADGKQNGNCNYRPTLFVQDGSRVDYKVRATNSYGNSGNTLSGYFTKGEIQSGIASCDVASRPLNYQATRYEGSPSIPNQHWQNADPDKACYYTCNLGRTGEKCDQPVFCPVSQINEIYAGYLDELKKEMGSTNSPGTERFRYKRFDAEFPNHTTYYVASDGNNTNGDGSSSKPFQSIAGALSALYKTHPEGGFKIEVKDGLYTSSNWIGALNFKNRVLVQAQHDYKAVIQGNNMAISFNGTDNIILAGFEMKGNGSNGYELMLHVDGHGIGTGEDQDPYTDGFQSFEEMKVCDPNKEFLCHCKVKNATCDPDADPAYYRVDPAQNITVENCIIHDTYNNDVIKLNDGAVNIEIRGNMIYNPRQGGDQNIDVVAGYNLVFEDNIFFNDYADSGRPNESPSAQLMLKSAYGLPSTQNVDIRRNVFMNAQMKNDQPFINLGENGYAIDGLCQYDVMDVLIENNLFLHNNGDGPDSNGDQKYARYGSTIASESAKNLTIRSNTIQGFFQHSRHGSNANYKYNGAYNMGMGYALRMYTLGGEYGKGGAESTLGVQNENVILANNILADPTGRMGNITNGGPNALTGTAIISNNVYFNGRSGSSQNAQGVWSVPNGAVLRPLYEQGYRTGDYVDYVQYSILSTPNDKNAIFGDPKLNHSQELCLGSYPQNGTKRDCKNNLISDIPYRNGTKFNGKFTASSIEGVRVKLADQFASLGNGSVAKDAGIQGPNHDIIYQARSDGKPDVGAWED